MKNAVHHKVKIYKSLELALKDLEPFVRDGHHLLKGRPFEKFGEQRSREMIANWLLCVVLNFEHKTTAYRFSSDPSGGDGLICDTNQNVGFPTEHVMVYQHGNQPTRTSEDGIAAAVDSKQSKGATYASGKLLIVFNETGGGTVWLPNAAARRLPKNDFHAVWVVGLNLVVDECYVYYVTQLDLSNGDSPSWQVKIANDFGSWEVRRIQ